MQVLITGATGFLGRHLVERLLREGHGIKALVRPETDPSQLVSRGVEVVSGDVRDAQTVDRAAEDCQVIYHLAARTSHGNRSSKDTYLVNVNGTANVVRAALKVGVSRFILASTTSAYGPFKNRSIDESTAVRPYSAYTASKVQAEQIVQSYYARHGLPAVLTRITSVFGVGNKGWIGLFQAIKDGKFRMIGRGENYRQLADVSDIIEGLFLCGTLKGIEGKTYILAGNEPLRLRDSIEMIREELKAPTLPNPVPVWPLHLYRFFNDVYRACGGERLPRLDRVRFFLTDETFDLSHARGDLGYVPKIGMNEAIHRMAEWYRSEGYLTD